MSEALALPEEKLRGMAKRDPERLMAIAAGAMDATRATHVFALSSLCYVHRRAPVWPILIEFLQHSDAIFREASMDGIDLDHNDDWHVPIRRLIEGIARHDPEPWLREYAADILESP